jgi:hypothetical protein
MIKPALAISALCLSLASLSVTANSSAPDTSDLSLANSPYPEAGNNTADIKDAEATKEPQVLMADNLVVGSIRELNGKAILHKQGEVRGVKATSGDVLKAQDILRTKRNSQAVVQLIDGSTVVLQEQSSLHLKGLQSLSLEEGTVLFDIRKRGGSKGLQVATKTAVIGVKGTQFLVKDKDNKVDVYLNEGKVEVNPVEGSFKHYKAVTTASFDDYSKQMMAQFEEEKKEMQEGVEQMKREFVEYLKSYDMNAGTAVSISGDELTSYTMPDDYNDMFKELEKQAEITRKKFKAAE